MCADRSRQEIVCFGLLILLNVTQYYLKSTEGQRTLPSRQGTDERGRR